MMREEVATPEVTVVIAAIDARATVRDSLRRFLEEAGSSSEVILVDASRDGSAELAQLEFPRLRVLRRPPGTLTPELWREGLEASNAPLLAFSTAQMIPCRGWLSALRARMEATGAAAVGGPIEPARKLSALDRAVYLLRYVHYLRPLAKPDSTEPPGDNALYRRDRLQGLESTWESGFWEAEVHRALTARGERLVMAPEAMVEFQGGGTLLSILRQRRDHAWHYGAARGARMSLAERFARSAAAPLVPAVLVRRILSTLNGRGRRISPWLSAVPSLSLLLAAWTAGETAGTWLGPPGPVRGGTVSVP